MLVPIEQRVNNAMVTVYSRVDDIQPEELRRMTEVTYLRTVYGTMEPWNHIGPAPDALTRPRRDHPDRLRGAPYVSCGPPFVGHDGGQNWWLLRCVRHRPNNNILAANAVPLPNFVAPALEVLADELIAAKNNPAELQFK